MTKRRKTWSAVCSSTEHAQCEAKEGSIMSPQSASSMPMYKSEYPIRCCECNMPAAVAAVSVRAANAECLEPTLENLSSLSLLTTLGSWGFLGFRGANADRES